MCQHSHEPCSHLFVSPLDFIREAPKLLKSGTVLAVGNCGIYIGPWDARVEDTILVKKMDQKCSQSSLVSFRLIDRMSNFISEELLTLLVLKHRFYARGNEPSWDFKNLKTRDNMP
jgi:hypothetical protein